MSRRLARLARLSLLATLLGCTSPPLDPPPGTASETARASSGPTGPARSPAAPPSVLLVTVDTFRADRLGTHGALRPTDPTLRALASQGFAFESMWSDAPWTWPSLLTLASSLPPLAHGGLDPGVALCAEADTLAEVFQRAGFRTAFVGSNPYLTRPDNGFEQGFDRYEASTEDSAELLVPRVLDALVAPGRSFVHAHFFDPHCPFSAPEAARAAVRTRAGAPARSADPAQDLAALVARGDADGCWRVPGATVPSDWFDAYDAELHVVDDALRALVLGLHAAGRLEETWIVVTGDHGEELGEHGRLGHGEALFAESLRVPWVLRPPGPLPPCWDRPDACAPRLVPGHATLADVAPTLAALLGLPVPPTWTGQSQAGALRGVPAPTRDRLLATNDDRPTRALLADHLLVIEAENPLRHWMYDLSQDPWTMHDLLRTRPAAIERWLPRLHAAASDARGRRICPPRHLGLDAATVERLRALGYIDAP